MASIRKRKQFEADVLSVEGTRMSGCFVIADIETTVVQDHREVTWQGKITSLSEPQRSLHGPYLLRPSGGEGTATIDVIRGAEDRAGITSDEYIFLGSGAPPELP